MRISLLALISMATASSAFAESGFKYDSAICDFTMELPEEVIIDEDCSKGDDGEEKDCIERFSYTKTIEGSTSIHINFACNNHDINPYDNYNREKMIFTAESFTISQVALDSYNTHFVEHENSKRVYVVGDGKSGLTNMLYIGNVWLGKSSLMSFSAKLVGSSSEATDTLFKTIVATVQHKNDDPVLPIEP